MRRTRQGFGYALAFASPLTEPSDIFYLFPMADEENILSIFRWMHYLITQNS